MVKKVVLLAVAGVLVFSVAAFAYGGPGKGTPRGGWRGPAECPGPRMVWSAPDGGRWQSDRQDATRRAGWRQASRTRVEFPAEITEKMTALKRIHLEMRLALMEEEPDLEKARELFGRSQVIRNELAQWRFNQYLENLQEQD